MLIGIKIKAFLLCFFINLKQDVCGFFPSPLCQLTLFTQLQPTVATQFNIFLLAF
jgi:hypothetical protein